MLRPQTAGAAYGGLPSRMSLTHRTARTGCARAAFAASARCAGRQPHTTNKEWMQ
jgi:hypothetical protein